MAARCVVGLLVRFSNGHMGTTTDIVHHCKQANQEVMCWFKRTAGCSFLTLPVVPADQIRQLHELEGIPLDAETGNNGLTFLFSAISLASATLYDECREKKPCNQGTSA